MHRDNFFNGKYADVELRTSNFHFLNNKNLNHFTKGGCDGCLKQEQLRLKFLLPSPQKAGLHSAGMNRCLLRFATGRKPWPWAKVQEAGSMPLFYRTVQAVRGRCKLPPPLPPSQCLCRGKDTVFCALSSPCSCLPLHLEGISSLTSTSSPGKSKPSVNHAASQY